MSTVGESKKVKDKYIGYEVGKFMRKCLESGVNVHDTPGLAAINMMYISIFSFLKDFIAKIRFKFETTTF